MSKETWLHLDMDAFYASVEQRDEPKYRGKPVIIGAKPGTRGVVSTCSYEARAYGIHSAMPINEAYKLCPSGLYLPPRMQHYSEVSSEIMQILSGYSPHIQQLSIDEAFLNITGCNGIWGDPLTLAKTIKEDIWKQCQLTLSAGIASNRLVAKMASDFQKPNGLTLIEEGQEANFVAKLSISALNGVGKKTQNRLRELKINSVEDLLKIPQSTLKVIFGDAGGRYIFSIIRGIDPGIYEQEHKTRSISNEHTFPFDCNDMNQIEDLLFDLSYNLIFRLQRENMRSSTLVLKLRLANFSTSTIRQSKSDGIETVEDCFALALGLLKKKWDGKHAIRLIGLACTSLESNLLATQSDLFNEQQDKRVKLQQAVLNLHKRYRMLKLAKARNIQNISPDNSAQKNKD